MNSSASLVLALRWNIQASFFGHLNTVVNRVAFLLALSGDVHVFRPEDVHGIFKQRENR